MARDDGTRLCRLHETVGRRDPCPGATCPFWEPGGAVLEGRCAFDVVDLSGNRGLAALLLEIRAGLEAAQTEAEEAEVRHALHRLLNETVDD